MKGAFKVSKRKTKKTSKIWVERDPVWSKGVILHFQEPQPEGYAPSAGWASPGPVAFLRDKDIKALGMTLPPRGNLREYRLSVEYICDWERSDEDE